MARESLHKSSWRNISSFVRSFMVAALLCIGIGLVAAPPASAHDQLISSNPTDGQRFSVAPSTISLTFSAKLLSLGFEVRVVDAASKNWSKGSAVQTGDSLNQALSVGMPDGEYQVRWRVVSSDGHPINGSFSFLVGKDAKAGSIPDTVAQQEAAPSGVASTAESAGDSSAPAWVLPAILGAAAGLALYVAYLVASAVRRRSHTTED